MTTQPKLNQPSSKVNCQSVELPAPQTHDESDDSAIEKGTAMGEKSFGATIAALRKEKGMTQLDLAQKMGVTDKAVSKWERDLSFPDVSSLPRLAEELGISVDELLEAKTKDVSRGPTMKKVQPLVELVLKAVALAMGVGVIALTIMDEVAPNDALRLLGIGLACLALVQIAHHDEEA